MVIRSAAIAILLLGAVTSLTGSQTKPAPKPVQLPASGAPTTALPSTLDKIAQKWVDDTLKKMTIDEKVGQLLMPSIDSTYLATDTDEYERVAHLVTDLHVGGILLFGGTEPSPSVLLDDHYGSTILGDPLAAACSLNRLQTLATIPLLNAVGLRSGRRIPDRAARRCFRGRWPSAPPATRRSRSKRRASTALEATRDRRARRLLAARRRQQQPAQSRDQHAVVRRESPDAVGKLAVGVRPRAARGRHARDAQAFSRARRHGRRLASRAADHLEAARATRCRRVAAVSRRASRRAPTV